MVLWDYVYIEFNDRTGIYTAHGAGQGASSTHLDELLRDIGGNGYELVTVTSSVTSPQPTLYFKRPRPEQDSAFTYGEQPVLRATPTSPETPVV